MATSKLWKYRVSELDLTDKKISQDEKSIQKNGKRLCATQR